MTVWLRVFAFALLVAVYVPLWLVIQPLCGIDWAFKQAFGALLGQGHDDD